MASLKTQPSTQSVTDFLQKIQDGQMRKDCSSLIGLMSDITGDTPVIWGRSIIGFGEYSYNNAKGEENRWFLTGFSPHSQYISIYVLAGFRLYEDLLKKLGKYRRTVSCLYIKKLEDISLPVLSELVKASVEYMQSDRR